MKKNLFRIVSLIIAALALIAVVSSCGGSVNDVDKIKARGKLIMATNASFPPFEFVDGSEYVGVDVDMAKEIAADLGVELEIADMEFASIIGAVQTGKADLGIAGMSVNEERKQSVDFSIEYTKSQLYILVKTENTDITGPDGLVNKTIAVQTGTTSDTYASDTEGATMQRFSSFLDAAQAVKTGKADAMVVDMLTAEAILAENADLKMLEEPLADEGYAIAVAKGNQTLLDAVNATLTRLIDEGKIEEFKTKYAG
jgi:polar amino acid transport system substrate-binding protein